MRSKIQIMFLFSLGYFFYYLARYNFPIAIPFIKEEFNVSSMQIGMIATALTLGYAIGQFINGFLVDRKGPRIMFAIGGLGSMAANFFMGINTVFQFFILGWLVNGYFQAMGYPSTLKLIVNWFKPDGRGKPLGVSEFFQSVASILILPFAGFLAMMWNWRLIFIVPSIFLGISTIIFYIMVKDSPSKEEKQSKPIISDMIESYRKALGDWRMLMADLSYGCCQFTRYAMITWIPSYLFLQTHHSIFKSALIAMTFQIGGTIGSLLVGWLSDMKVFRPRRWILITIGMTISGISGGLVGCISGDLSIVIILMIAGAGIEALEVAYFLTPADYLGKELIATGVGCMNAIGKAMATIQGVLLGWIIDTFGYGSAFAVAGTFSIIAAILIIPSGIRRGKNI